MTFVISGSAIANPLFSYPFHQSASVRLCAVIVSLCSLLAPANANTILSDLAACGLKPAAPGTVVEAKTTGAFRLQDGRKLKLSGVRTAPSPKLLENLVGRSVIPYQAAKRADRTNFTAAHILLPDTAGDQEPIWLQQALLQQGQAFIYIYPDQVSCAKALRSSENTARKAGLGIWGLDLLGAAPMSGLQALPAIFLGQANQMVAETAAGHYGIIRGLVISTGSAGRWRYLNFGRNYTQDFTVRLTASVEKHLSDHGFTLKGLKNRTIEVRGIIQSNGGPLIDVFDKAQMVILE